jgi:hypothetical protein
MSLICVCDNPDCSNQTEVRLGRKTFFTDKSWFQFQVVNADGTKSFESACSHECMNVVSNLHNENIKNEMNIKNKNISNE